MPFDEYFSKSDYFFVDSRENMDGFTRRLRADYVEFYKICRRYNSLMKYGSWPEITFFRGERKRADELFYLMRFQEDDLTPDQVAFDKDICRKIEVLDRLLALAERYHAADREISRLKYRRAEEWRELRRAETRLFDILPAHNIEAEAEKKILIAEIEHYERSAVRIADYLRPQKVIVEECRVQRRRYFHEDD